VNEQVAASLIKRAGRMGKAIEEEKTLEFVGAKEVRGGDHQSIEREKIAPWSTV